jgi:hypothetical protein
VPFIIFYFLLIQQMTENINKNLLRDQTAHTVKTFRKLWEHELVETFLKEVRKTDTYQQETKENKAHRKTIRDNSPILLEIREELARKKSKEIIEQWIEISNYDEELKQEFNKNIIRYIPKLEGMWRESYCKKFIDFKNLTENDFEKYKNWELKTEILDNIIYRESRLGYDIDLLTKDKEHEYIDLCGCPGCCDNRSENQARLDAPRPDIKNIISGIDLSYKDNHFEWNLNDKEAKQREEIKKWHRDLKSILAIDKYQFEEDRYWIMQIGDYFLSIDKHNDYILSKNRDAIIKTKDKSKRN